MATISARSVAASVLERVDKSGAFAAAALDAELTRAPQLEVRDRALATQLVYGSLRMLPWLDAAIDRHSKSGTRSLDRRTRAELRIAVYQLFFLERVPAFAAVNAAVEGIRDARGDKLAGFANAILRKLAAEAERGDGRDRESRLEEAILESVAPWIRTALEGVLGPDARAFLLAGRAAPPTGLRIEVPQERDAWIERLARAAPAGHFERGSVSPHAVVARGAGRLDVLPGWKDGAWSIQEEGSQVVALAVGARAGDVVLDACAGRGNKTGLLARAVGAGGAVDAADRHPAKLDVLGAELRRIGLSARATFALDWTVGTGDCRGPYDRILVDAPCSGIGTLHRRPDLRLRRVEEDMVRLPSLQTAVTTRAAGLLRPGGRLVYAVCSVFREEGEEVVAALERACPWLEPAPFDGEVARRIAGDRTFFRLLPNAHGTDGYFVASFGKKC